MTDALLIPDLTARSPSKLLNIIFLALGVFAAILFIAYLIRCYVQEFRRNRRMLRRRRSSSAATTTLSAPLTFGPPKRKAPAYRIAPTIYYTVTASPVALVQESTAEDPEARHNLISVTS